MNVMAPAAAHGIPSPKPIEPDPYWTGYYRTGPRDAAGIGLLGHRRASTTNRYVHLDDATPNRVAERVAVAIDRKLTLRQVR